MPNFDCGTRVIPPYKSGAILPCLNMYLQSLEHKSFLRAVEVPLNPNALPFLDPSLPVGVSVEIGLPIQLVQVVLDKSRYESESINDFVPREDRGVRRYQKRKQGPYEFIFVQHFEDIWVIIPPGDDLAEVVWPLHKTAQYREHVVQLPHEVYIEEVRGFSMDCSFLHKKLFDYEL